MQYAILESDGHTNLTVTNDSSFSFWFNPSWSSVNQTNGTGPGGWGRLLEIGAYTTNAANGWFSLFLSPDGENLFFSAEDTNGVTTNYLTAPISWIVGDWHFLALTWSPTNNSALYVDGVLLTNGGATTILPGTNALTNGFFLGSDTTGAASNQAHGKFDDLYTFNVMLSSNSIHTTYNFFGLVDYGVTNFTASAPFTSELPSGTNAFSAVTGAGFLQWAGLATNVSAGGQVYLTNTTATLSSNFSTSFGFAIGGGVSNSPYDVFGTVALTNGATNCQWFWLGQGFTGNSYLLTNQPGVIAFYLLGTSQDSDGDGLTDAYERLVTHTDPNNPDTSYSGLSDGWYVYYGLNPLAPLNVPNARLGYWRFNTNSWIGEQGQLPLLATNLASVAGWSSNAVQVDNASAANLRYAEFNTNNSLPNINCRSGTVRFWINPDWTSSSGPGSTSQLIEMGDGSAGGGYWSLSVSSDGTHLYFQTATNSTTTTYFTNTISWTSNTWHQLALTYSPGTNGATKLYVDGASAATGPPVVSWPSSSARPTYGLNFGSSRTGSQQSRAALDELETFNYPLAASNISNNYEAILNLNPIPIISFTNSYVTTSVTTALLNGEAGAMALLVDNTNLASATWMIYSSNMMVNLGTNQGWHNVWIGLRALPTNAAPNWQLRRLKLDLTLPLLVVTNSATTSSVPLIQVGGYCAEALSTLTYDLSNAAGIVTNLDAGITRQFYDTNSSEITTNWFESTDVRLTNGANRITFHATDLAGNTTVTNYTFTLDYSSRTNAPAVQLYWPQNGVVISGSNYTWRGWVDDPTATVTAQFVDTSGMTNIFNGFVERNGNFWVENLPLQTGTNFLTLSVTDSATNIATTNIAITPGSIAVTISNVDTNQIWNSYITASGTIGTSNYSVWVNGIKAVISGSSWAATNVPMIPGGTALLQARAIPNSDNSGNGTGGSGGTTASFSNLGDPSSSGAIDAELETDKPTVIRPFTDSYTFTTNSPNGSRSSTENVSWIADSPYHIYFYDTSNLPGEVGTVFGDASLPAYPESLYNGLQGSTITIESNNGVVTTNFTSAAPWTVTRYRHADSSATLAGANCVLQSQTTLQLLVGGKGLPGAPALIQVSCNVTQFFNLMNPSAHATIPNSGVKFSGRRLGTDGIVNLVLPAGAARDLTPNVPGIDYHTFSLGIRQLAIRININGKPLSPTTLATTNFCVGQYLAFFLDGIPGGVTTANYRWGFTGIFDNATIQPCPTCSANPINDSSLLHDPTVIN